MTGVKAEAPVPRSMQPATSHVMQRKQPLTSVRRSPKEPIPRSVVKFVADAALGAVGTGTGSVGDSVFGTCQRARPDNMGGAARQLMRHIIKRPSIASQYKTVGAGRRRASLKLTHPQIMQLRVATGDDEVKLSIRSVQPPVAVSETHGAAQAP